MSNGDDEPAETPEDVPETEPSTDADETEDVPAKSLDERLNDAEAALEDAETEADLDEIEATLDVIAADVEAAELPEPEDEDEDDPTEVLESRIEAARSELEAARGPYAEDVQETFDEAAATVRDTEWTKAGEPDVRLAVETALDAATQELDGVFYAEGDDLGNLAAALEMVGAAAVDAELDADEDAETIAALLEAGEELESALDDAEEWDDLTVVEQLTAQGFYDRMNAENRKDFPPELTVVRIAEAENDPERILMALDALESDFMQENCLNALKRLGSEEAFEEMHARAQKRKQPPIEVLGKIGDERAVETLADYTESSNPPLQRVTLRALGEIGSTEATQAVANALVDEDHTVRSAAARALGLIGDTRAIDPLSDVLADENEEDSIRTSAAWALVQIGTERALKAASQYADDRAYTVQVEAEKAQNATTA